MSSRLSESGQATGLVFVGLMLLAIPAGLAVAQGLSTTTADQQTIPTATPPLLGSPTPSETSTSTATETPTSTQTPTPEGDDNQTDGNGTTGQPLFVNDGIRPTDGVTSDEGCSAANYTTIRAAVDAAEPGDTVAVCPGSYPEHVEVTTSNLTITASNRLINAAGDATITNANESAVWINASGVTLQGFNISVGKAADYAIEVGGEEAVIEHNTVESYGVGIFLSDGHTETGECKSEKDFDTVCKTNPPVDPALGAASGGRVLNNSVTADNFRIWVDADRAVIQHNFATERQVRDDYEDYNSSIISSGNDTIIRENTVQTNHPVTAEQSTGLDKAAGGIKVGKNPFESHNNAYDNRVVDNVVDKPLAIGVLTKRKTAGTSIRGNSITSTLDGVNLNDDADVRNNTISAGPKNCIGVSVDIAPMTWAGPQQKDKGVLIKNNTLDGGNRCFEAIQGDANAAVIGNTIRNYLFYGMAFDICRAGAARIAENRITGTGSDFGAGIYIFAREPENCTTYPWRRFKMTKAVEILDNKITDNRENGIVIGEDGKPDQIAIHGNLIRNSDALGINNHNASLIVNATNNIWACGGPSSGADPLADPYTGRLANGSGDAISGGNGSTRNGHPITNVHFDPFKVQNPASCSGSQPTPTGTPTPTRTPTATPPSVNDGAGAPTEIGDGGGTGSGQGAGAGDNGGDGGESDAPGGASTAPGDSTVTQPPPSPPATPTATPPPTPTPPDTPTPTPVVEPGFGVFTWLVGVALLLGLLASTRRATTTRGEGHD